MAVDQRTVAAHEQSLFEVAVQQFNIASDVIGLDDGMRSILSHCNRELTVNFPVEMDDGSVQVFTGHRVPRMGRVADWLNGGDPDGPANGNAWLTGNHGRPEG